MSCGFGGTSAGPPVVESGVTVLDDGVIISPDPFTALDFQGAGVTVTDGTGGVAIITIPGDAGAIDIENDGAPLGAFTTLDFGTGVTATDAGGGVASINATIFPNILWVPEQWAENNIQRNLVNHVMDCQVSTSFDTFKMITTGSITALSTRLIEAITAGTLTVVVTKNGAAQAAATITHTSGSNPTGGVVTVPIGSITYVPGDLLGMLISTNNTLAPLSNDIEAMIQVTE